MTTIKNTLICSWRYNDMNIWQIIDGNIFSNIFENTVK